jgi:hypothetical protein
MRYRSTQCRFADREPDDKGDKMTLVQKTIGNTAYYTDGVNYYTFHVIGSKVEPLYIFACRDLGITKSSGFTAEESARINDLAGTGKNQKTKYLLLKNGQAVQMPYKLTVPDLRPGDTILRQVTPPSAGLVKCPHCASTVARGQVCSACGKPLSP